MFSVVNSVVMVLLFVNNYLLLSDRFLLRFDVVCFVYRWFSWFVCMDDVV